MKYFLLFTSLFFFSFQGAPTKQWALNNSKILEFKAGHERKDCDGKGEPYMIFGSEIIDDHVSCHGFGNQCTYKVKIDIMASGTSLSKIVATDNKYEGQMFFNEEFKSKAKNEEFHMPNRSIFSEAEKKYVNIPSQILAKDLNSTFYVAYFVKNISFSDKPLYKNK